MSPQLTITGELEDTGGSLRDIFAIIEEIKGKFAGPRVQDCTLKEAAPWPPQLGIKEWIQSNHKAADDIRGRLRDILQSL